MDDDLGGEVEGVHGGGSGSGEPARGNRHSLSRFGRLVGLFLVFVSAGVPGATASDMIESVEKTLLEFQLVLPDSWQEVTPVQWSWTSGETEISAHKVMLSPETNSGVWQVEIPTGAEPVLNLSSDKLWTQPISVVPGAQEVIRVDLLPACPVFGTLNLNGTSKDKRPDKIFLKITESEPRVSVNGGQKEARSYDLDCPVDASGNWHCSAPAGRYHVRLSIEGFVPQYLWDLELPAGESYSLHTDPWKRGASVSGWVEAPYEGKGDLTRAQIELRPLVGGDSQRAEEKSRDTLGLRRIQVQPDERGFFQIVGVPQGTYQVSAGGEGWSETLRSPVDVAAGSESRLMEPLELAPLAAMEWVFEPPHLPNGSPWSLSLVDPAKHEVVRRGQTDLSGVWTVDGLPAGEYILVLSDDRGAQENRIVTEKMILTPGKETQFLNVPIIELTGLVTAYGEPVTGTLWLGGRFGAMSIAVEIGEDGVFEGFVPREGQWALDIARDGMAGVQSLEPVVLEQPSYGGRVVVEIELPDTRISGSVLDSADRPIGAAQIRLIDLESREKVAEITGELDGSFQLEGLRPGDFKIYASAAEGQSELLDISVEEGVEPAEVRLVVDEMKTIVGSVQSPEGPVTGAFVTISPSWRLGTMQRAITGGDGKFEVEFPSTVDSLDIVVLAPSHALASYRLPLSSSSEEAGSREPLLLHVERSGALLELDLGDRPFNEVTLRAGEVQITGGTLLQWLRLSGGLSDGLPGQDGPIHIPRVAPGAYALCPGNAVNYLGASGRPAECDGLYLAPTGVGRLALLDRQPEASVDDSRVLTASMDDADGADEGSAVMRGEE